MTMTTTREQQLEERVAQLEQTLAALIRSTLASTARTVTGNLGAPGAGGPWDIWQHAGATHEDVTALHAHLVQHSPLPQRG